MLSFPVKMNSLGACRIIGIFAQIEANSKKLPEAYTEYSEDNFFEFNEDMGKKGIIRQAPRSAESRLHLPFPKAMYPPLHCGQPFSRVAIRRPNLR